MTDATQCGTQLIVFALPNRIELVIVAAAAIYGQAEKGLTNVADEIFEFVLSHDGPHGGALLLVPHFVPGCRDEKASRDQGVGIARLQHIASKLQPGELIERQIAVQGVDDPIAIAPRVGPESVAFKPLALAEPGDIEPMPGPTLAILRFASRSSTNAESGEAES